MSMIETVHGGYIALRRIRVLAVHFAELLPQNAAVLDVGTGNGALPVLIQQRRPDARFRGIDVLVRPQTSIPVEAFDGKTFPAADKSYDVVMFADVLHHTTDPKVLLREARRVARQAILLKDHLCDGWLARPQLRFMDGVGNARYGVELPYNYWLRQQWQEAFDELGLRVENWRGHLGLYPIWGDWLFGRSLHFVARLNIS